MSGLRQIKATKFSDIIPASLGESEVKPEFEWVDPTKLYVEDRYQRRVTDRSQKLIKRIIKDFSWSKFKPPVCSYSESKLVVIDGQHTAIAAASIPGIEKIPVMVVVSPFVKNRAEAFMGHNRDRTQVTPQQLYYAALAAEDPVVTELGKALQATGCTIVRSNNNPVWVEGQTYAVAPLVAITTRKGRAGVERVLKIFMEAKRAPIMGNEIKAVSLLLWDKDWQGRFSDYDLSTVIRSKTYEEWAAKAESTVRKGQGMSLAKAVAISWFKKVPKKRKKGEPVEEETDDE